MSNVAFFVPKLLNGKAYVDYRGQFKGGYGWRGNIPLSNYKNLAIHHTVTNPVGNLRKEVETVYNIHVGSNKWGGIGYNFIIGTEEVKIDGVAYAKVGYVGDIGSMRAHAPNERGALGITKNHGNMYLIGIALIGRFDQGKLPSDAQIRSLYELSRELVFSEDNRMPNLKNSWGTLQPHKVFDFTACPGDWNNIHKLLIEYPKLPKDFNGAQYLNNYKDLRDAKVQPMTHWILFGKNEGRSYKTKATPPKPTTPAKSRIETFITDNMGYKGDVNIDDFVITALKKGIIYETDLRKVLELAEAYKAEREKYQNEANKAHNDVARLKAQVAIKDDLIEKYKVKLGEYDAEFNKRFWQKIQDFIANLFRK